MACSVDLRSEFHRQIQRGSLFVAGSRNAGGTGLINNDAAWVYGDRKYNRSFADVDSGDS